MKLKFKIEYFWFAIFALCFLAFQLVQDNIRPNYMAGNKTVNYFLGVAPNFFPAVGIPALFVVLLPVLGKRSNNRWLNKNKHLTANGISLTGLLSWEFLQITTTNGRFDWNDIIWTLTGAMVFALIWAALLWLRAKNQAGGA